MNIPILTPLINRITASQKISSISRGILYIHKICNLMDESDRWNLCPQYHQIPNEYVQNHLASMGTENSTPISHDLERCARRMEYRHFSTTDSKKIAICSQALGKAYQESIKYCLASHRRYCETHGIPYFCNTTWNASLRHSSWCKIPLIYNLLKQGYEQVIYLDADTLIMNPSLEASSIFSIPPSKSMLITEEYHGICCGVMSWKNSPDSLRLLDLIWLTNCHSLYGYWEQDSLKMLLNSFSKITQLVHIEENSRLFGSMCKDEVHPPYWATYQKGDFLVHFASKKGKILNELIEEHRHMLDVDDLANYLL